MTMQHPIAKKRPYTAVILNARLDADRVSGQCYCDREGRFLDGEYITTSKVLDRTTSTVTTEFSLYKVVWAV